MDGFHGAYLRFDLSRGVGERVALPDSVLAKTLGGVGLGVWLLHEESFPGCDPFAAEAPLIFSFSPLVGTGLTTSAKFAVVAKSPLTGGVSDALASSHFAIAGKRLGVDAIVLIGACDVPSELVGGALRPTAHWGASAADTAKALRPFGRVAAIGPAGERRVRYATISADGRHAGRGGLGAVMGSKNLKAIAVDGDVPTCVADPARVEALAEQLRHRAAGDATAKYRDLGTVGNLMAFDRIGALPTRNFSQSHFEGAASLSGERWRVDRSHKRTSCASCTIGCEHRFGHVARDGSALETRVEYESLFALGSLCGVADPEVVLAACRRCDELGLDTISTGATLSFAMECRSRGLLDAGPAFDQDAALVDWIDAIGAREGLGDALAEGSRRFAARVGQGAIDFAPQVKGLEMPGYEPRSLQAMALGLAVGTRGADHNRSGAYEIDFSENADRLRGDRRSVAGAVESEDRAAVMDSLVLCKFARGALPDFFSDCAALMTAVTGHSFDAAALRDVAQGIVDLRKAYNIREGWQPGDDTLPARFLTEPLASGPAAGAHLPVARLREMIEQYNETRGWQSDGHFTPAHWAALRQRFSLSPVRGVENGTSEENSA